MSHCRYVIGNTSNVRLCWFGGVAVALTLTLLASYYARFPGDLLFTEWVQSIALPGLGAVSEFVRQLGGPLVLALVGSLVAIAFFRAGNKLAASFLILAVVARVSEVALKGLAERPRPPAELVEISHRHSGFSFPSGHVLASVLVWGFLIYLASRHVRQPRLRVGIQVASFAILILTGLQRVYAGAHWPSDVVGGYLWGVILVVVLVWVYDQLRSRANHSASFGRAARQ